MVFSKAEGVVSGEMAEEGRGLWVGLEQGGRVFRLEACPDVDLQGSGLCSCLL